MKQAIKKGVTLKKSVGIDAIRSKIGLKETTADDLTYSNADKPISFYTMPDAFDDALKIPGFPKGYMSIITGWSNTGKSTMINCAIASAMNEGALPVIYDTENNFDFEYAIDCGMKATPIYDDVEYYDEETGEVIVKNQIIRYDGDFIYFNSKMLADTYGTHDYSNGKECKKRDCAVIEDIAYSMNSILDMQKDGDIDRDILFIWDSVGSVQSLRSVTSKTGNNMFDAGALSTAFNGVINERIPCSRKMGSPYTNTFVVINKIWDDSMTSSGLPSFALKGGKSFYFAARLIIHLGGVSKASVKKLSATAKGQTYNYGIISKIKVNKNQLPTPYNLTYEGEVACVHNGLCVVDRIDEYKKKYLKDILKKIEDISNGKVQGVSDTDISFTEAECED